MFVCFPHHCGWYGMKGFWKPFLAFEDSFCDGHPLLGCPLPFSIDSLQASQVIIPSPTLSRYNKIKALTQAGLVSSWNFHPMDTRETQDRQKMAPPPFLPRGLWRLCVYAHPTWHRGPKVKSWAIQTALQWPSGQKPTAAQCSVDTHAEVPKWSEDVPIF